MDFLNILKIYLLDIEPEIWRRFVVPAKITLDRLGDLIKQKGRTFRYLYDFGDDWEHELVIENSHYFNLEQGTELYCLEGERCCPPEDVGGAPGFFEFCKALKDPNHGGKRHPLSGHRLLST